MQNVACKSEFLNITNQSVNATEFEWDFCPGELNSLPSAAVFDSPSGVPFKVKLLEQNGQHYGFYTTRGSTKLFRLDFGNNIESPPNKVDLGNLGINFDQVGWLTIDIVKEGSTYFGFVLDYFNRVYRINFGSSITNFPSNAEVIYNGGFLSNPIDMVLSPDPVNKILFIANSDGGRLIRLKFSNSFASSPTADFIDIGYGGYGGMTLVKENNKWYSILSTFSGLLIKVFFEDGLQDITPSITPINGIPFNPSYRGVSVAFDNNTFYIFAQSPTNLYRITLGNSVDNNPIASTDLGSFNLFANIWGFSMHKVGSKWMIFSSENSASNRIYQIQFLQNCFSKTTYSRDFEPQIVTSNEGTFTVTLTASDTDSNVSSSIATLNITNQFSPDISFQIQGICVDSNLIFNSVSVSNLTSYLWSFGDTQTSNLPNPEHRYSSPGNYQTSLIVSAENGCANFIEKKIILYTSPNSSFTSPSGLICTNNQFNFINTTTDNFDGNLTYEWLLNDQPIATTRDLQYAFSTTGDQTVKLKTSIPGCTSESTQVISNVQAGPTVGFSVSGQCQDEPISFTNTSSGAIAGFAWNLGNGESITQINSSKVYSTPGDYTVTLESQGTNGCVSKTSKIVSIYSKPQTDFSIDLPPFSCAGTPSQFKDLTPSMIDSNITSWQWNFGDVTDNTATIKNPTHTYATAGAYSVSLQTTTNFGCSNTIQKSISILPSPVASFTNGLACLNQNLQFVNSSSGIKSSLWNINNQQFSTLNPPIQRFTNPGSYEIRLTVTGSNDCQNMTTKVIQIKSPPLVDFSVDAPCTGNETQFTNISTGGNDMLSSIHWDLGGNQLSGNNVNFTFVDPRIYGIRMNYLGQSGCTYTVTKNVSIVEGPAAKFTVSDEVGAAPLVVNFTNTSTPSNLQWEWNFKKGNTLLFSSPFKNISFGFDELGEYTASLKAINSLNCVSEFSLPIQVVIPQIRASLTDFKLVDAGAGAKKALFIFENKSNVPISDPEIVMDVSGGPLIKEQIFGKFKPGEKVTSSLSTTILPRSLVYACAELFVKDDLQRDDDRKCLSLQDESVLFAPYPNPVVNEFRFEWISSTTDQAEVSVYNSSGQLVFSQPWSLIQIGLNQISIKASEANLSDGLFYFTFQQGPLKKTFRFMVAKE